MQLVHHQAGGHLFVRHVAVDHVLIGEKRFSSSVALSATELLETWPASLAQALSESALESLLELRPEVVLIGLNGIAVMPNPRVLGFFLSRRIGCEMMNLASAARTFNVMVGEGRQVVLGLVM